MKWSRTGSLIAAAGVACMSLASDTRAQTEAVPANAGILKPSLAPKKVIEYGWDLPSPTYLRDNIREMEKKPFEGVMFRMTDNAGQVFDPKAWDEKKLSPQLKILSDIKWSKFTDNFLSIYAASTMDWFSDEDWKSVLAHTRFCARAAKAAKCKGILFDPEPYGSSPWTYTEQKHAKTKSLAEYQKKVRQRGYQFMKALSSEMPAFKLFMFYQYSMFYYVSHDPDPVKRAMGVGGYSYGLMASFLDGMLDAAPSTVQFIDGNEFSYYYKSSKDFYQAYYTMRNASRMYVAPELRDKFDRQVRAGQALYVDYLFNFRPDIFRNNVAIGLTPEERAQWFEHNTYYALNSSDEYVWLYSENMNWWKNENLPPGLENAVISAKQKTAAGQALDFDIADKLVAAQKKMEAALQEKIAHRTAQIPKITASQRPVIDGKLDEALYKELASQEAFLGYVQVTGEAAPKAETRTWVAYDDENLYVAFRNNEPNMKEIKVAGTTRDTAVWAGDSVEISVRPNPDDKAFYHFILSPSNVQWDAIDRDKQPDMTYDPNWKSATQLNADSWTVEVAIPWRDLKMEAPKPGTSVRANLARQRTTDSENTSWSQFVGGFQEPQNFGTWKF